MSFGDLSQQTQRFVKESKRVKYSSNIGCSSYYFYTYWLITTWCDVCDFYTQSINIIIKIIIIFCGYFQLYIQLFCLRFQSESESKESLLLWFELIFCYISFFFFKQNLIVGYDSCAIVIIKKNPCHPPASVKLHVGVEQGHHGSCRCPPAAHTGSDQTLLLTVSHHLYKARTFSVRLFYKILQLLLQLF